MRVSARTHAHYSPRRKETELVRLRRFSFLRDLIVCWLWLILLAWLVAAGVIAALRKQVEYASAAAHAGSELGLTAVAFSLSIRSHLHLGFAFRPREHLLAQAVHQVAPAGRAARIQRVFLVLPRGRPPESSSNARAHGGGIIWSLFVRRQLLLPIPSIILAGSPPFSDHRRS